MNLLMRVCNKIQILMVGAFFHLKYFLMNRSPVLISRQRIFEVLFWNKSILCISYYLECSKFVVVSKMILDLIKGECITFFFFEVCRKVCSLSQMSCVSASWVHFVRLSTLGNFQILLKLFFVCLKSEKQPAQPLFGQSRSFCCSKQCSPSSRIL